MIQERLANNLVNPSRLIPGTRVQERIVVTLIHTDAPRSSMVNDLGEQFQILAACLAARVEKNVLPIELDGTIIQQTGRVPSLVEYQGRALRVHKQHSVAVLPSKNVLRVA